jgi:hypothetical protein
VGLVTHQVPREVSALSTSLPPHPSFAWRKSDRFRFVFDQQIGNCTQENEGEFRKQLKALTRR